MRLKLPLGICAKVLKREVLRAGQWQISATICKNDGIANSRQSLTRETCSELTNGSPAGTGAV